MTGPSFPVPVVKAENGFLDGKENVRNCKKLLFRQQMGNR